jgi:hypothetical protein
VEVYNTTNYDINLNGWVLKDAGSDNHVINDDVWVPALGFAILGRNANYGSNGGVVVHYQYSGFELGNSGDEVILEANSTEVDRFDYNDSFDNSGESQQLDPDFFTHNGNDNMNNWCDTPQNATYLLPGGDYGSPGADNAQCP